MKVGAQAQTVTVVEQVQQGERRKGPVHRAPPSTPPRSPVPLTAGPRRYSFPREVRITDFSLLLFAELGHSRRNPDRGGGRPPCRRPWRVMPSSRPMAEIGGAGPTRAQPEDTAIGESPFGEPSLGHGGVESHADSRSMPAGGPAPGRRPGADGPMAHPHRQLRRPQPKEVRPRTHKRDVSKL